MSFHLVYSLLLLQFVLCYAPFEHKSPGLRSDHHTHQHTHCQQNFHEHHTDGRQAQHTKGKDASQLQALA